MKILLDVINSVNNIFKGANQNLDGKGERVDISLKDGLDFSKLDMYQKSHYRRYEFSKNYISNGDVCGDFACGTGYGTAMIAQKAHKAIGADINKRVINKIKERYEKNKNIEFININLLDMLYTSFFDKIISFETIEHLAEQDIPRLFNLFNRALKPGGKIIFSVPYVQEKDANATKMGFHLTFYIDEEKIKQWLGTTNFKIECFKYQNYKTHIIQDELQQKDFIISVAQKIR